MKKAWIYGSIGLTAVLIVGALVLSGVLTPAPEKSWDGRFVADPKSYGVRFRSEKTTPAPFPPGGVIRIGGAGSDEFQFNDSLMVDVDSPPIDGAPEAPILATDVVTFSDGSRLRLLAIYSYGRTNPDAPNLMAVDPSGKVLPAEYAGRLHRGISMKVDRGVTVVFECTGGAEIRNVVLVDAATGLTPPDFRWPKCERKGSIRQFSLTSCHLGDRVREVDFLAFSGATDSAPVPVGESRADFSVGPVTVAALGSFRDVPTISKLICGESCRHMGSSSSGKRGHQTFFGFPRGESPARYAVTDASGEPWKHCMDYVSQGYFAEGDSTAPPVISRAKEVRRIRMRLPALPDGGPSLPEDPLDWPLPATMKRETVSVKNALALVAIYRYGHPYDTGPTPSVSWETMESRKLTEFPGCRTLREVLRKVFDQEIRSGWTLRVDPNGRRLELNPPEPSFLSKARAWLKSHAGFLFP